MLEAIFEGATGTLHLKGGSPRPVKPDLGPLGIHPDTLEPGGLLFLDWHPLGGAGHPMGGAGEQGSRGAELCW